MKGTLKYAKGDATKPKLAGNVFVIHVVNDEGLWGKGFVASLSRRWPKSEEEYRRWYRSRRDFKLGEIQSVFATPDLTIINMIAQHGVGGEIDEKTGAFIPPIRYDALEKCLTKVAKLAKEEKAQVAGPRFGSGLAGGDWKKIEELIQKCLVDKGINVTIFDLE